MHPRCSGLLALAWGGVGLSLHGSAQSVHSNDLAIVAMTGSGEIAFFDVDAAAILKTVPLGKKASLPTGIAITPDRRAALVTCPSGHVASIDVWNMESTATLELLAGPEQQGSTLIPNEFEGIAVDPSGTTAYVTEANEKGQLFFFDIPTMSFTPAPRDLGDEPRTIAVKSDGSEMYVLDEGSIHVLSAPFTNGGYSFIPQPVGTDEVATFALTPDETRAILVTGDHWIYLVDTTQGWGVVDSEKVGGNRFAEPNAIAITADGATAIVTNHSDQSINFLALGPSSFSIVDTIPVGGCPGGVALTADGKKAVVTLWNTNRIQVVDVPGRSVLATVSAGSGRAPTSVVTVPAPFWTHR